YRLRTPFQQKSWEVLGQAAPQGLWQPAELKAACQAAVQIDFAAPYTSGSCKRLLACSRTLFLADQASVILPLGRMAPLGLPYQQYALAYTQDILTAAYGNRVSSAMLMEGGYVAGSQVQAFSPAADPAGWWWLPSGTAGYSPSPASSF